MFERLVLKVYGQSDDFRGSFVIPFCIGAVAFLFIGLLMRDNLMFVVCSWLLSVVMLIIGVSIATKIKKKRAGNFK